MNPTLRRLRLWLLAALLVGGQLLALAHAAEHASGEATEVCLACLAAQELTGAVPPTSPIVVFPQALTPLRVAPIVPLSFSRLTTCRRARAPPAA